MKVLKQHNRPSGKAEESPSLENMESSQLEDTLKII